jgi:hypothetical protein
MTDQTMLDALGPDAMGELVSRREAIGRGVKVSAFTRAALALGSVPVAIGALAGIAKAQPATGVIVDVLQYALLLENLEAEFYQAVLGTSTVPAFNTAFATVRTAVNANAAALGTLTLLRDHEVKHVTALRAAITALGATPATYNPATTFDFTGNRGVGGPGPFAPATADLGFLLAVTQTVEDTGVRAYKGQAGKLLGTATLTTALQIHSLEARHAARIRRIRRVLGTNTDPAAVRAAGLVKGAGAAAAGATFAASAAVPAASVTALTNTANLVYANEGNTSHTASTGTIDVATQLANLPQGTDTTMAFDEPLTALQVRAIVQPFVIPTIALGAGLAAG